MAEAGFATWSRTIATWVGVIGVGIGGWTAIDQQQKAIAAEQAQAEKDYELMLRQFDQDVKATYIETFKMFEIFNRAEQLRAREKIYADELDGPDAMKLNDVFIYFDFFDALKICVEDFICDPDVAAKLFKPYAVDAWELFEADAVAYRETDARRKTFGQGVEWIAKFDPATLMPEEAAGEAPAPEAEAAEGAK